VLCLQLTHILMIVTICYLCFKELSEVTPDLLSLRPNIHGTKMNAAEKSTVADQHKYVWHWHNSIQCKAA